MTHRGPFQPQTFCDSVTSERSKSVNIYKKTKSVPIRQIHHPVIFTNKHRKREEGVMNPEGAGEGNQTRCILQHLHLSSRYRTYPMAK